MGGRIMVVVAGLVLAAQAFAKPYAVGDIPFDAVGRTVDGRDIKVSDYKGQVVVISFWATWCKYCMKELPVLSGIQKHSTPGRLQVIAINYGEDRQLFRKIVFALADTPMVLVSDPYERAGKKYGVDGIPHMVIVSPDGKVAAVHVGYSEDELPALIDEINRIGKSRPAGST